jgi:hypothetical protein
MEQAFSDLDSLTGISYTTYCWAVTNAFFGMYFQFLEAGEKTVTKFEQTTVKTNWPKQSGWVSSRCKEVYTARKANLMQN